MPTARSVIGVEVCTCMHACRLIVLLSVDPRLWNVSRENALHCAVFGSGDDATIAQISEELLSFQCAG